MENEDVVGAAPAGDAPTTSEWSTILLPTNVSYIRDFMVTRKQVHKYNVINYKQDLLLDNTGHSCYRDLLHDNFIQSLSCIIRVIRFL